MENFENSFKSSCEFATKNINPLAKLNKSTQEAMIKSYVENMIINTFYNLSNSYIKEEHLIEHKLNVERVGYFYFNVKLDYRTNHDPYDIQTIEVKVKRLNKKKMYYKLMDTTIRTITINETIGRKSNPSVINYLEKIVENNQID